MTKEKIEPEALAAMRTQGLPDTEWLAFQNHDLGSVNLGHLRFLAVGPSNTIKRDQIKKTLPDFPGEINWRYQLIGVVNLETGEIV